MPITSPSRCTIASRFGELPSALPLPALPEATFAKIVDVAPSAFVIAFLAAVESLLSAMVADRMIGGAHRPNAEVLAQGAANIGSALFGGLPATGPSHEQPPMSGRAERRRWRASSTRSPCWG